MGDMKVKSTKNMYKILRSFDIEESLSFQEIWGVKLPQKVELILQCDLVVLAYHGFNNLLVPYKKVPVVCRGMINMSRLLSCFEVDLALGYR